MELIFDLIPQIVQYLDHPTMVNFLSTKKEFYHSTNESLLTALHRAIQVSAINDLLQLEYYQANPEKYNLLNHLYIYYKRNNNTRYLLFPRLRIYHHNVFHPKQYKSGSLSLIYNNPTVILCGTYEIKGVNITIKCVSHSREKITLNCQIPDTYLSFLHFSLSDSDPNLYLNYPYTISSYRKYLSLSRIILLHDELTKILGN